MRQTRIPADTHPAAGNGLEVAPPAGARMDPERFPRCRTQPSCPASPSRLPLLPLRDVVVFPHGDPAVRGAAQRASRRLKPRWSTSAASCWWRRRPPPRTTRPRRPIGWAVSPPSCRCSSCPTAPSVVLVEVPATPRRSVSGGRRPSLRQPPCSRLSRRDDPPAATQRGRGSAPRAHAAVRPVRQTQQEDSVRGAGLDRQHRGRRPPGRHHRRPSAVQARVQADRARPGPRRAAPREPAGPARARGRHPQRRQAHPAAASSARWRRASDFYLNEQVKAIQKELGEGEEGADLDELEKKIRLAKMPAEEARKKAEGELKKLKLMSPMSAEASVVQLHRSTLVGLPWSPFQDQSTTWPMPSRCSTRTTTDSTRSRTHPRIPRGAAARRQRSRRRSCAWSARRASARPRWGSRSPRRPGANSSAWRSAACATRPRSRGHRRTYIGAMPGKVLQSRSKVGASQPGVPARRDRQARHGLPAATVLGAARGARPEQNHTFPTIYVGSTSTCRT